jgi:hypothetical protein
MQIADRNVDKVLERLESDSKALLSAGLLTPEQVERLTAIGRETDPHAKVALVSRLSQQLLSELEDARARLGELRSQLGLEEGGGLLESDRLSPAARERLKEAIGRNAEEVRQQARMQADLHAGTADPGPPRPGGAVYV